MRYHLKRGQKQIFSLALTIDALDKKGGRGQRYLYEVTRNILKSNKYFNIFKRNY